MNSEKIDEQNDSSSIYGVNYTKRFVSEGENQLYKKHNLGKTGLIELVDYMGGDGTVERVATLGHGTSIFPENLPSCGLRFSSKRILERILIRAIRA